MLIAQELTTSTTDYSAVAGDPTLFSQPAFSQRLLENIKNTSRDVLTELKTVQTHVGLPTKVVPGSPLIKLIDIVREPEHGHVAFEALWKELTDQSVPRPPILFCLDGLSHIMRISDYRNQANERIHSHDLALVRHFTDLLSGKLRFPHGGAVVAATTRGNFKKVPSMELALAQRVAAQEGAEAPAPEPYCRDYDSRIEDSLKAAEVIKMKNLTQEEARALMEYWAASGVFRKTVDTRTVAEGWASGGSGVIGELERANLLTMKL
jgi:small subunit ribosomal protein S29